MTPAEREKARNRQRDKRARDRALAAAGLTRVNGIIVPITLGDYLRATGHMPLGSEDEPGPIACGLESLVRTLLANADGSQ